ncbi:hypothetical protein CathTA2_1506 [Caldalkalibacillus thermarum TA2.A1]|uniref:Small multi-drug export protein n=1 Tax=Caldalkalibacillus thermarum (strain TA2.A1) TaxID=986075 RepID=F5L6Q6_CALTT|nr:small multi-drug export protein [Caldalkalibacillus thermarum]EGL82949.1 hypothetical protein CathTA2_1506 [Caldalkalibacillus thermarum TA2.A1]QZT33609.1 small multi-drug export protein [Caldalkalibacillus thermarum TA2.A1]
MAEWIEEWQYLIVFLLSATPWIEIAVVIPIAILVVGMSPLGVGVVSFIGNYLPVVIIVLLYERWKAWRAKRRPVEEESDTEMVSKRRARAQRIFERYGTPGLALFGPLVTGIHLAAVIALMFGVRKQYILLWMGLSLGIWAVVLSVGSVFGIDLLERMG